MPNRTWFVPWLAAAAAGTGCASTGTSIGASMRPAFDPALAGEERLAVQGRRGLRSRQRLHFGEFEARPVGRDTARTRTGNTGLLDTGDPTTASDRRFHFVLRAADAAAGDTAPLATVRCAVRLRARGRAGSSARTAEDFGQSLTCAVDDAAGGRWHLALAGSERAPMRGTLARDDGQEPPYAVRPVTRFTGIALDAPAPMGWEFVRDGRAVGAVEQINAGAVVLPRRDGPGGDPARRTLAAAAAALLLFEVFDGSSIDFG